MSTWMRLRALLVAVLRPVMRALGLQRREQLTPQQRALLMQALRHLVRRAGPRQAVEVLHLAVLLPPELQEQARAMLLDRMLHFHLPSASPRSSASRRKMAPSTSRRRRRR